MIHVQGLTVRFGSLLALDHVSFDVAEGEAVALWGANGAGKTTTLRCLLGLLPFAGEARVAGYDVRLQGRAARQQLGFVPQELNFHDDLSVEETMDFYARLKRAPRSAIAPLLERVGLTAQAAQPVRALSGGMKQRLALAIALLGDPPLLLLDEPTANLDAPARADFLSLLAGLKDAGRTLLFSSHRQGEVAALADRVLRLAQGRLVERIEGERATQSFGLRLYLAGEAIEPALAALARRGFQAHRNGRGVHVQVAPDAKGEPIHALFQAGIAVADFDVEEEAAP